MEENSDAGAGTPEQPNVRDLLVNNARELFVLCDKEDKGFITKRDMQRLRNELPLDPDQLELVFDSLDLDHNGYLTLEEFTDGFGMFLGFDTAPRRMSCASATGSSETSEPATAVNTTGDADSDDDRFEEFLDNLGAQNIFKDEEYVQETWARLQMEQDPTMIRHFENFLAKVMGSIQNSEGHCFNLESALLNRKHKQDEQVELLYEEMEQQHKLDKEKLLAEERQKERKLRETLETELRQKDQLLHDLMTKHAQLESQLRNLHSNEVETKQENAKLIKELGKLERRLVDSEKTVEDMNRQVDTLRQQSIKEKRTRAKTAFKVTEGIAIERESLVKQLGLLRSVNKDLLDQKDEINVLITKSMELQPMTGETADCLQEASPEARRRRSPVEESRRGSILSSYISTPTISATSPTGSLSEEWRDMEPLVGDQECEVDEAFFEQAAEDDRRFSLPVTEDAPVASPRRRPRRRSSGNQRALSRDSSCDAGSESTRSDVEDRASSLRESVASRAQPDGDDSDKQDQAMSTVGLQDDPSFIATWSSHYERQQSDEPARCRQLEVSATPWKIKLASSPNEDSEVEVKENEVQVNAANRSAAAALLETVSSEVLSEDAPSEDKSWNVKASSVAPSPATLPTVVPSIKVCSGDVSGGPSRKVSSSEEPSAKVPSSDQSAGLTSRKSQATTPHNANLLQPTLCKLKDYNTEEESDGVITELEDNSIEEKPEGTVIEVEEDDQLEHDQTGSPRRGTIGPERMFKVVLIGDSSVGKTSILNRFCKDTFKTAFRSTIGVDYQMKSVMVDGHSVVLQLWDTAGQERFRSITKQYYRKADGVMVVYDVTKEASFKSVRGWITSMQDGIGGEVVLMLLGNKVDLAMDSDLRQVSHLQGNKLAHEMGALFYETSAKTALNVTRAVQHLASLLRIREDEELDRVLWLRNDAKKQSCCK